jgi:hypothetical protein
MKERGDREPAGGGARPPSTSPTARTGHPVNPKAAALLALQRTAGNLAVSRYMPVPPGTPAPIAHALNKTPLEQVQDLLEYGVIDFAVTDEDARKATTLLGYMDDGELTKAVAHLDGSSTPYLDRLADNAPLPVVRLPAFARIMRKRAPSRNKALAERLVSYGIVDWEITPPEAEAAQTLIDALPESDRDKIGEEWMRKRIEANIAKEGDYEKGVGEQLLDGALLGDFNEDPTFWNVGGQIALGLVPYAGQVADIRDLLAALDDMFNKGGYKKFGSWLNLLLVVIGFIPGVGDAVKALGRGAFNAVKGVKGAVVKIGRGLWDLAARKLVEPLIKPLFSEAILKTKQLLKELLDSWTKKMREAHPHGPPTPHGETPGGAAAGADVPGGAGKAVPSVAELTKQTDDAFAEVAAQSSRRVGDVVSEMVHETVEALKRWARKVYGRLDFATFEVGIEGDYLVLYGISSKIPLFKADIVSVKKESVEKTKKILSMLGEREALLKEARSAAEELAGKIRYQAILVSEELGEHVATILIKRQFPGAKVRYTGKGSGVLDKVFEVDGVLHVVEAKGGAGRLGSREIASGERAQQASAEYLVDIIDNMLQMGGEEAKIAKELRSKLQSTSGRVRMWVASTGPLSTLASEPLDAKLVEVTVK